MNKSLLLILLLSVYLVPSQAQILKSITFDKGYIITKSDSLQGYIGLKDLNSGKIKYRKELFSKKTIRIHPKEVVCVSINSDLYEWVPFARSKRLMKRLSDGRIKLYEDTYNVSSPGMTYGNMPSANASTTYIKKDFFLIKDGQVQQLKKKRFRETLLVLTEEYPELKKEIDLLTFPSLLTKLQGLIDKYNSRFE